jgi:holo-ACP synthase/triphosphoribosyl-dephospho-CoA synthase
MPFSKITLEQMLLARDRRASRQAALLSRYGRPVISFTMNIAGPVKDSPLIRYAFRSGLRQLEALPCAQLCREVIFEPTGPEALLVYETQDARLLKAFCIRLESEGEAGRLFDLDVLDANGEKLSRETGRTCLVCGGPVSVCSRSRAHGLEAITARTRAILEAFAAETLGEMAENALLAEVHFTPKPGLVDEANNGAHRDMDVPLFERSAHALRPCFVEFVRLGIQGASPAALQQAGVRAEQAMFAATGGVNTHKGAIYSGALLLHAAGRLLSGEEERSLCGLAAQTAAAIPAPTGTHGAAVRAQCGGIRTEAVSGYPTAQAVLRQLRQSGPLDALLLSMSRLDDSTLWHRGGAEGAQLVRSRAADILAAPASEREARTRRLDMELIERNLSPGGSADLLAMAFFLEKALPLLGQEEA